MDTLGDRVRLSRTLQKWNQDDLAEKAGTNKQRISAIEGDKSLPTVEQLVKMCEALAIAPDQKIVWLLTWLDGKLRKSGLSDEKEAYQKAIGEAIVKISQSNAVPQPGTFRSLEDFPRAFKPLTIICGDRREPYLQSRGDIFAYSVSITDLMFLPRLGLDRETIIRSDKLFACMDDDYLRQELGKTNLLVIGSPAANFAARRINNYSVFRFDLAPEVRKWTEQLDQLKELNDTGLLRIFWRIAENPELIKDTAAIKEDDVSKEQIEELVGVVKRVMGERSAKDLMDNFRKPGLTDPIDGRVKGQSTRQNNDFAVISLAKNPFSDTTDYVCILAAGIHGPGTAHAVRVLGREDEFRDRPFGGVIEVTLNLFKGWPARFEQAHWEWQTRKYTTPELLKNFKCALRQAQGTRNEAFVNLTQEEIKNCLEFVRSVSDSN